MKPIILPPANRSAAIAGVVRVLGAVYPGKPVRVKIEVARPDKTPAQNRYLWAVPYKMLSDETGFSSEELHEYFCGSLWGWKDRRGPKTPSNPTGIYSAPIRTTTRNADGDLDNCSAEEMAQLWAMAQQRGAQLGLIIPDPDPDYHTLPRSRTRIGESRTP